jgi:head-tail adaptor
MTLEHLQAGFRNQLVTFQRATVTEDDYGGEVDSWADIGQAWAQIQFGSGEERRSGAQVGSSQAATFSVLSNPLTRSLKATDRISYLGGDWDIQALNPVPVNKGIVLTATRRDS